MEQTQLIFTGKICPYCDKPTEFVDSVVIYGRSYGMIYLCKPCDAYCGVHKGSTQSLGRLANKELRHWKKEAHKYFDLIWKTHKLIPRTEAYKWLAGELEVTPEHCHIGMFDVQQCKIVVEVSKRQLNDNRRLDIDLGAGQPYPYFE